MSILTKTEQIFPLAGTLRDYDRSMLRGDLTAGVTVAIMLIPQAMAYAVLAGLPPVYGLYASVIPVVLYALFGTSRQLGVGPVAMISLMVLSGVGIFAEPGSGEFIRLAILTAFGVGVVQILMGLLRMGFLVNFLSHPVLSGFTSAAAIIIGASQIKNLLGLEMARTTSFAGTLSEIAGAIGTLNPLTALFGIVTIVMLAGIRRWKKNFPTALLVVVAGTVLVAMLGLDARGVQIVGSIQAGFPAFDATFFASANGFSSDAIMLAPLVLAISLISYMESIAVAKSIAAKRGYQLDANRELIGLGAANLGGAFFQGFPVAGSFSRTAVNDQSGSRTTIASLVTAGIVAITVLFLTPLFHYLPSAVLAAIIMVAVAGLFDAAEMKHLWHTDRRDFAMLMVTFLATLGFGIEMGIAAGVVLSLLMVIYQSTRPHAAELGELDDTGKFRSVMRYPQAQVRQDVLVYRFDAPLYFANAGYFRESLSERLRMRNSPPALVVLDATAITSIDSTGIQVMDAVAEELSSEGMALYIVGATGPVRDTLSRSGVVEALGEDHFFFDVADALRCFDGSVSWQQLNLVHSPCQTN
jgi:sulfate permease, SulP family